MNPIQRIMLAVAASFLLTTVLPVSLEAQTKEANEPRESLTWFMSWVERVAETFLRLGPTGEPSGEPVPEPGEGSDAPEGGAETPTPPPGLLG